MQTTTARQWENWDHPALAAGIDRYWRTSPSEMAHRRRVAQLLVSHLVPGGILEVGCGTGLLYEALQEQGVLAAHLYQGGDVTPAMLALARAHFPGVHFRHLDVFVLRRGLAPNVLCAHVLQHLPHYGEALARLTACASGLLCVVTWLQAGPDAIETRVEPVLGGDWAFYMNHYNLEAFLACCRAQPGVATVTAQPLLDGDAISPWAVFVYKEHV